MPDNTLPMMTGFGPFGPIEMGGMFTVVKVREGLARDDYTDPGSYKNPPGTVAYEVAGAAAAAARSAAANRARQTCRRSQRRQAAARSVRPSINTERRAAHERRSSFDALAAHRFSAAPVRPPQPTRPTRISRRASPAIRRNPRASSRS